MAAKGKYLRTASKNTLIVYCPGCETIHPIDLARWEFQGNSEAPTFSPSLLVNQDLPGRCHSFIRNGQWHFLEDCQHSLKGQTVPMQAINEDWEPEG